MLLAVEIFGNNLFSGRGPEVDYNTLLSEIRSESVQSVLLREDTAYVLRKNSQISADRFSASNYDYSSVVPQGFVDTCIRLEAKKLGKAAEDMTALDLPYRLVFARKQTAPWYAEILPYVLMSGIMIFFLVTIMNQQGGGKMANFGHSPARLFEPKGNPVTFRDVAGAAEEKEEMTELVEFLKNPQRFSDVGARIPKGVLLVGPPGTGKTLLARAVAGEAGVPFMTISGSDFVEMFVGVGASRVRDLFDQAKRKAPCIVFIDEIDAVGRRRGAGLGGGHDEREQTLNQLLVEMDGFSANEGVIVLAATNRKDILDPALLRPGRFDRQITVGYPDLAGREAILRVHAQGKPLENEQDLYDVARRTPYSSGADLENIMNEAAILCARDGKDKITAAHLSDAVERIQMGPEKKSHAVTLEDKRLVACHEAGHAIVGELLPGCDKVHLVTIMPRGGSGGHTLLLPERESDFTTRQQLLDYVAMALGGYAAEGIVMGEVSTGAGSDLKRATEICRRMVTQYGMSDDLGPIWLGGEHDEVFLAMEYGQQSRAYSEDVAARIDAEVQRKLSDALSRAREILTENRAMLDDLSAALIEKETIDRTQFEAFLQKYLPERKAEA
ncbi:MAG: ATP-dependent zinc metalloprotease FtsH [Clostridiales bacterium]|nr:ATP-dependent zinc metalloprotease FtsH [Clostridiales bacterium]